MPRGGMGGPGGGPHGGMGGGPRDNGHREPMGGGHREPMHGGPHGEPGRREPMGGGPREPMHGGPHGGPHGPMRDPGPRRHHNPIPFGMRLAEAYFEYAHYERLRRILYDFSEGRPLSPMDQDELMRAFGRPVDPREAMELYRWIDNEMRYM